MFCVPVYCISKENLSSEKVKIRDNDGREQHADFVYNALTMPD